VGKPRYVVDFSGVSFPKETDLFDLCDDEDEEEDEFEDDDEFDDDDDEPEG